MKTRFLFNDGSIVDHSTAINSFQAGTATFTMSSIDKIYIGQEVPFNHLYFKMSELNTNASDVTVEIWDGTDWIGVAEIIDETDGFTANGYITWTPDKDLSGWAKEDTDDSVTDLTSLKIYDLYWMRITVSATLTQTTFDWIGQKFNTDDELFSLYPILSQSNMKTAFKAGKTDWEEQVVAAGREIARDLIRAGVIKDSGQVLRRDLFMDASIHKTAEIAFRPFGDDYEAKKIQAHKDYEHALNLKQFKVDLNKNARLDSFERKNKTGFLKR